MNKIIFRIGYLRDLVSTLIDLCNIENSNFVQ